MEPQPEGNKESKTGNQQGRLKANSGEKDSKNSSSSSISSGAMSVHSKKTVEDSIEKSSCVEDDSTTMASRSSPHVFCAICLDPYDDESFIENCSHSFCFVCLSQWSKVKAECPLCKKQFTRIRHNVQGDYAEDYIISSNNIEPTNDGGEQASAVEGIMAAIMHPQEAHRSSMGSHTMTHLPHSVMIIFQELLTVSRVPSPFRQRVYENSLWVKIPRDLSVQAQTAAYYRNDLTRTRRLIPWLVREIVSLFPNNTEMVTFLLELIMKLVLTHNVASAAFRDSIEPYMGHNLSHFIHEFHGFAISPYTMETYDRLADYSPPVYRVFAPSSPDSSFVLRGVSTLPNPNSDIRQNTQQEAGELYRIRPYTDQSSWQSSTPFVSNENMPGSSTSGFEASQPEIIELSSDEDEHVPMITISSDEEEVTPACFPLKAPLTLNSAIHNTFPPMEHVLQLPSTSSGITSTANAKQELATKTPAVKKHGYAGQRDMKSASKSTSVFIPSVTKIETLKDFVPFQRKRRLSSSDSDEN